ncbi:serine-rich coiled-coil domain-containing protein 2-like isoform X1 [Carassius carassius]|uniref:serine-rich coiled-coil domain-containing protein 2-like isoform X1 n=1 Tax=Carassius carassius TaxID=217509 RepID=UPI002868F173|nr:serine-rich coiled-coil domain-containing protein 2-like isoform X1 [Carassius carassius]
MEQKVLSKSSMVSRLPKFGARPVNGTSLSLPNGTTQTALTQEGKNPPARPNGVVRASSYSMKWRKDSGGPVDPSNPVEGTIPEEKKVRSQHSPGSRELKSPSTTASKVHRSAASLSTGSPKPAPKSPKSIPSHKPKPQNSKITPTSKSQDLSQKSSGSKPTQNGTSSLGSSPSQASSSGLQHPRANSSSTRSTSRDRLSQSNDSLSRQLLMPDYMVRSQSFTHFKQLPSPTSSPMTRSFSFNKAVELAKPLANTQLRPPRTVGLQSPLSLSKGHLVFGLGGLGFGKGITDRLPAGTPSSESLTPPNSIKRTLLPNSVLTNPSLQAYKLNRPIPSKLHCPLVVGRSPVESDVITPPLTPELLRCATKNASDSPEEPVTELGLDGNLRYTVEGMEDMSLSSASSLERNDTSEEFLDDFDNLGDQLQNGIPQNKYAVATPTQTRLQGLLKETMDWTGIGLAGGKADLMGGLLRGPPLMSPDMDRHATSSLELSPSNSSGGTYMWDEEGMEPLGHNTLIHRCSSYESELNSIGILNNLDNTGSCDLENDDLMLDVDLPEDGALLHDGMAHFERSDRGGRPAQWRRRQQRWTGTDHAHNDNRLVGFHYDPCRAGHRPVHPAVQHDSHTVALDELTLKHLAEDCSSVKSQLLKLKSMLQMDDGEISPESLDSSEDDSRAQQMEELMKEVAHLREELKNKDQIITRLTHQQHQQSPVRCPCHQQKSGVKGERRTHHDKSTQTVWRPPHHHLAPQILQPISHIPKEPLIQGKLARTVPTGGHNDAWTKEEWPPTSCPPAPCTDPILPPDKDPHVELKSLPDPEELSRLLSTHLHIQDNNENDSPEAGEQIVRLTPESHQSKLLQTPHPSSSFSPRVLQPPHLHRRVKLPALSIGGGSGPNPKPNLPPPPSRGLPCFSAGNHVINRGRLSQPWPAVVRSETDPQCIASMPLGVSTRLAKPKTY